MADIFTMGVDLGSTASKCVILKNGSEIVSKGIVSFGVGTSGPERAVAEAMQKAGLTKSDIAFIIATGYGRESFSEANRTVSELSCHATGALWLCPRARTVIDIGGQDAKVLSLGDDGRLENFVMNDKCAAGTGRFLDVMARVLETGVEQLEGLAARAESVASISSTCTVFAESEVISQLSRGTPIPDIAAGIHRSVAVRTAALAKRLGMREELVMTGGVAQNGGVVRALERELGVKINVAPHSQLCGALGAALLAFKKVK